MKKFPIIIALFLCLLALFACHKDKEMDVKDAVVSNEEITVSETQASFSWQVDFAGKFQTGVEVSPNENMAEARRVEATKEEEKFVAVVDGLSEGKKYYYRIVVWNKFSSFEGEEKDFTTKEKTVYLVKATCQPADGGNVIGTGSFEEGKYCTLNAICNQGYDFVNWTENGNPVSTNASYTFKVTQNRNLVVHFAKQKFMVSVSATPSTGGTVSGGGQYDYGQSCTVSATAASGYTFSKWTENGTQVSTNANYTFTVNNAHSLVAHFTELQPGEYNINVSANLSDGGSVSGGGVYHEGVSCTVTATPNEGYTFANWTENGNVVYTEPNYTFIVNSNRTLVANFTAQNYTVSVSANPTEGGTVSGEGTYQYGQSCTVSAMANYGFIFNYWTENGNVVYTAEDYEFIVTCNRTLAANFTAQSSNSYTINVSANPPEGGTVSGEGTYQEGQSCTVVATANEGYTFTNWTENGNVVFTEPNYTFTVTCNRTLVANFSVLPPNTYNINVSANPPEGGTVSGGGTYQEGQSCTVNATAATGYVFQRWMENGNEVSTDAYYTFSVTASRNLVAQFEVGYTINVSAYPSYGGSVTGGGVYNYGQNCTLTAIPASGGWVFEYWTKDYTQVSTNATYTFQVTESASFMAYFHEPCYVDVYAVPSIGGTVTGDGTYSYGQTCTVSATAASGYTFLCWRQNNQTVSTDANYSFTVLDSYNTLRAHFINQAQAPTGAINSIFTISDEQQVWFSRGNLQYKASSNTWQFAEHQYDYVGDANSNIGQYCSDWIDMFGWGTSGWDCGNSCYMPWESNTMSSYYGPTDDLTGAYANSDWGVYNGISYCGNITYQWRTLSRDEWFHVFYNRATLSGIKYAKAVVGDVNGIILLPDNWDASFYYLNNADSMEANYNSNVISMSIWENIFETYGAVFLPAGGWRTGTTINTVGLEGYYWSTTHFGLSHAYSIWFTNNDGNGGGVNNSSNKPRAYGYSVRLVKVIQ